MSEFSAAWQGVTCADCGANFQCTPNSDYYHRPSVEPDQRTLENGVCESCLLGGAGLSQESMVRIDKNAN